MNQAILQIDTDAVAQNWQRLDARLQRGKAAAVVKADAYGLGATEVSRALQQAGCALFFVATLEEAITLRSAFPEADIAVFQGILEEEEKEYLAFRLKPVLNTPAQITLWKQVAAEYSEACAAIIHVDTGMQRLGLSLSELKQEAVLEVARTVKADMLMTHYACASEISHPMNAEQLALINEASRLLPHLTTSYANSAAHFLPPAFHGQVSRPGCALYGINPCDGEDSRMLPVASLSAPILQVREIDRDTTLGYCATIPVSKGMRTVTVGIGYADGISRQGSNRLYGFIGEHRLPLLGRVTMDMLCFDASNVPEAVLQQADRLVLMDKRQTVDDLARIYHTIGYEVLTSIGNRVKRIYTTSLS